MNARKLAEKLNASIDKLEQVDYSKFTAKEQQTIKEALGKLINKIEGNLEESRKTNKAA